MCHNICLLGVRLKVFLLLMFILNGSVVTSANQQMSQDSSVTFKPTVVLSTTDGRDSSSFVCERQGSFPVPDSCGEFYRCEDISSYGLTLVLFSCPSGTIYDAASSTCDLASRVMTRPECTAENDDMGNIDSEVRSESRIRVISISSAEGGGTLVASSELRCQEEVAVSSVSMGLLTLESITRAATGTLSDGIANGNSIGGGRFSRGIENKLTGIVGRLNGVNLTTLEMETETKINAEIMKYLVNKEGIDSRDNFEVIQKLINQGIIENHIRMAVSQGLINQVKFAEIQVGIGDIKEFIGQEVNRAKCDIKKGFESISNSIDKSIIKLLSSNFLTLITEFHQRANHLQSLPEERQKNEIERNRGYFEHLEASTLKDILYIIHQNLAIPSSDTDKTAVTVLDLLIYGLHMHASMLLSAVSTNVYLAGKALKERNLEKFNSYMLGVTSSTKRVKLSLGYRNSYGLLEEVKDVLNKVQLLSFALDIHEDLSMKQSDLNLFASYINSFIDDNTELSKPRIILGTPNFDTSFVSVPIGPWVRGKQVSYAIQYVSERGISRIGEWSRPYVVQGKGNPTIRLLTAARNMTRLMYRRFNQDKPKLVAILSDNEETSIRDISRDIINAVSTSNETEAVREARVLLDNGADVNVSLEKKMMPLHYAAIYGNVEAMKLLFAETVDVDSRSSDDEEALHFAALSGAEEMVVFLINKGASVNSQTKLLGWSPLHISVANNHVGVTRHLVQNGALINIRDKKGLTPLHLSIIGRGETFEVLLEKESLDVNAKDDDGQTPLHYAARGYGASFAHKLLQNNATEVNSLTNNLLSPLHFAAVSGNVEIIAEVMRNGASVTLTDKAGSTPLHYAVFYSNADATLALIEKDESIKMIQNDEGKTALDLANESNNKDIVMILTNTTEYLLTKIKGLENLTNADQSLSDNSLEEVKCTQEEVLEMAIHAEETCMNIGHITNYVRIMMSLLPLNVQYQDLEEFTEVIENYNRDLGIAKNNANLWRNRNSISRGVQQAFRLAKDFELTFNSKYKIKQERVAMILQRQDEDVNVAEAHAEIRKLEGNLQATRSAVEKVIVPSVKQFMENQIRMLENELEAKRELITIDPAITLELQELIDFLEFVRNDALAVKQRAANIKIRMSKFRDNLKKDMNSFERNNRDAKDSLARLQLQSVSNNKDLLSIQKMQEQLRMEVEEAKQHIAELYDEMYSTLKLLRHKRRSLVQKMGIVSDFKYVGALLTGFIIGRPLLMIADSADRQLIREWNSNIAFCKEEAKILKAQVESKQQLITNQRDIIANSTSNSETLRAELHVFNKLNRDLQSITVEVPSLQPSISKAITGLEKIEEVFSTVTDEIEDMIRRGKSARTASQKEEELNSIDLQLSQLQCYWKGINIFIMDLKECSSNYKLV